MPASGPFNCLPQTHLSIQASAAWLDDYTGTAETLFKATAVYTTQAYTARCYSDWQHHIKHSLKWWGEHKRGWYENQVRQMNMPRGRKRNRPKDQRARWASKRPRT